MRRAVQNDLDGQLNERLAKRGFRFTPQREHVYAVLLRKRDHPTAEEVFIRAKRGMPDISMATVYNCLDALVACGLARCQSVFDIDLPTEPGIALPKGYRAERYDIAIHGRCPACGHEKRSAGRDEQVT
jgi:Fe2+ or Zn2+ uptake regulation protein